MGDAAPYIYIILYTNICHISHPEIFITDDFWTIRSMHLNKSRHRHHLITGSPVGVANLRVTTKQPPQKKKNTKPSGNNPTQHTKWMKFMALCGKNCNSMMFSTNPPCYFPISEPKRHDIFRVEKETLKRFNGIGSGPVKPWFPRTGQGPL